MSETVKVMLDEKILKKSWRQDKQKEIKKKEKILK